MGGAMVDENFEWDDDKAAENLAKHNIDFSDARRVFGDPGVLDDPDDTMDYGEDRYRAVGIVNGRLIAVFYTYRGPRIRIISARRATRTEQRNYAQQNAH
jgi:uncharacterized protein